MDYGGGQYSTTSYGAQGGAGGGGFMGASQGGGGGSQGPGGGGGKGTYGKDTLRPVTILQVLNAQQPHPDADFSIDDVEISQVTFVGQIRNISTQTTNITYKLDDGTGTVEVKQWIDTDAGGNNAMDTSLGPTDGSSAVKLAENEWARVWGRLKAFNNKRHVGAHVIRPIADKMEITHHLLEATYVHLYFVRGPLESGGGKTADQSGAGAGAGPNGTEGGSMAGPRVAQLASLSMEARRVYQMLKSSPQSNEGVHVQNLAVELRLSVPEVLKAGDELSRESLIYTTIDDNTWAVLDF